MLRIYSQVAEKTSMTETQKARDRDRGENG